MEYKRPAGGIHWAISTKFLYPFQDALGVKICLDLLDGLWSYGGFKLTESGYPKFSAPPSGETVRQTPKVF